MTSFQVSRRVVLTALCLLAAMPPHRLAAQLEGGPAVGEKAPVVTTTDLDGRPVDLGAWIGTRPVLIEFWATWCESCRALKPMVDSAYARFHDQVEFIGVDVALNETVPGIRDWLAEHRPGFRVLYDSASSAVRAYEVQATSTVYIIGQDGRVAYAGVGGSQELMAPLARVTAASSSTPPRSH